MPGVAPAVTAFDIVTVVPWPIEGVTGLGAYEIGVAPVIVPSVIGFCESPASPTVVSATVPANDWFRLTLKLPTFAVVPVAGSVTAPGAFIWKSGICIVRPE